MKSVPVEKWEKECHCPPGVHIGDYGNQICISDLPIKMADHKLVQGGNPKSICLDLCVAGEVIYLWSVGITTTGCCCGHGKGLLAYIGVVPEDEARMLELGYSYQNASNGSFKPKWELSQAVQAAVEEERKRIEEEIEELPLDKVGDSEATRNQILSIIHKP